MPNPKSNFFNGGYASRVEGKDASGEYLTAAQRKENFKRQAVSFINGKSDEKTGAGVGKGGALALRAPSKVAPEDIKGEEGKSDEIEKLKSILVPGFAKIEGHLESILKTFKDESKLDKKQDRKDDILAEKSAKKGREAELEGKDKPKIVDKAAKAVKPAKGLFDIIFGFVKNVLMGAALLGLVNILENPQTILKPIIGVVNGIVGFLNQVLEVLFRTLFFPINALISGFNLGFEAIFGAINTVLGWFKQEPLEPWKIDRLEAPQIPTIPLPGEPKLEALPVQKAQGGGEIQGGGEMQGDASPSPDPGDEEDGINLDEEASQIESELDGSVSVTIDDLEKQVLELDQLLAQVPIDEAIDVSPSPSGGGKTLTPSPEESPKSADSSTGGDDRGVVQGVQSAMGGGIVQKMKGGGSVINKTPTNNIQRMKGGGKTVSADQISAAEGGPVESNSGVSVSGLGPDTQLVAAQPGEIVMSKKAVDMIGADKLLALNKEAGGTNKPVADTLEGVKVSKMKGGGHVGGSRARVGGASKSREIPGSPSSRNTRVRVVPIVPKQKDSPGSAASADQKSVSSFSASDVNNFDLNVVKSIYNIVS